MLRTETSYEPLKSYLHIKTVQILPTNSTPLLNQLSHPQYLTLIRRFFESKVSPASWLRPASRPCPATLTEHLRYTQPRQIESITKQHLTAKHILDCTEKIELAGLSKLRRFLTACCMHHLLTIVLQLQETNIVRLTRQPGILHTKENRPFHQTHTSIIELFKSLLLLSLLKESRQGYVPQAEPETCGYVPGVDAEQPMMSWTELPNTIRGRTRSHSLTAGQVVLPTENGTACQKAEICRAICRPHRQAANTVKKNSTTQANCLQRPTRGSPASWTNTLELVMTLGPQEAHATLACTPEPKITGAEQVRTARFRSIKESRCARCSRCRQNGNVVCLSPAVRTATTRG